MAKDHESAYSFATGENGLKPNTPEWEASRKAGIGASDAPVILGLSPYKKPWQLYREKKDVLQIEQEVPNFAMNHGKAMEPQALRAFVEYTGCECEYDTDNMMVWHKDKDLSFMFATYDGLVHNDFILGESFVEIKCPITAKTHELAKRKQVPPHYFCQMQHQFAVHSHQPDVAYYWSYFEGEGILIEVNRDQAFIDAMIEKEKEFMEFLRNNIEPERTDKRKKKTA